MTPRILRMRTQCIKLKTINDRQNKNEAKTKETCRKIDQVSGVKIRIFDNYMSKSLIKRYHKSLEVRKHLLVVLMPEEGAI